MLIDIGILAEWAGAAVAVCAPVYFVWKRIKRFLDSLLERVELMAEKVSALESWTSKQQHDIEDNKEEMALLLTGTLACLKGLQEQGCNGAVTKSIPEIEAFLVAQATKTKSASPLRAKM